MKRIFFGGIAVLAVAAVVAWNFNVGLKAESMLSDNALANIEALAQTEGNPIELPDVVIYCDSFYEDCILGSGHNDGHCWYSWPRYSGIGWYCEWSGKTNDTCCSFG